MDEQVQTLNDYAFDATAVISLHVYADTESRARELVETAQGIDFDHLSIAPNIEMTELSARTTLQIAYATNAIGQEIDTSICDTDSTLIAGDADGAPLLRQLHEFRDAINAATDLSSVRAAATAFADCVAAIIDVCLVTPRADSEPPTTAALNAPAMKELPA
jgi:hypothetical protein